MHQTTGRVADNRRVDGGGIVLDVEVDDAVVAAIRPGHFFMIRDAGPGFPLLSRPFSVFDHSVEGRRISFLYEVVGLGTRLFSEMRAGDRIGLLGPLGNCFEIGKADEAANVRHVMIAGGVGNAPFFDLVKDLRRRSNGGKAPEIVMLFGARSEDRLIGLGEFQEAGIDVRIATDDGSRGHHGTVVDLLERVLAEAATGGGGSGQLRTYACGPNPMLAAVCRALVPRNVPCQVSMEAHMACGFGACVGCAFPVEADNEEGYRFALVCKDGPIFPASVLRFEVAEAPARVG